MPLTQNSWHTLTSHNLEEVLICNTHVRAKFPIGIQDPTIWRVGKVITDVVKNKLNNNNSS